MYGRMKHGTIFIFTPLKCLRQDLFFLFFFKFTYHLLLRSRRKCTPAHREGSKTTWQSKTKQGFSQRPNRALCLLFIDRRPEPFQNHGPGFRSPDLVVQSLTVTTFGQGMPTCGREDVGPPLWLWDPLDSYLELIAILCTARSCHSREVNEGQLECPPRVILALHRRKSGYSGSHISKIAHSFLNPPYWWSCGKQKGKKK